MPDKEPATQAVRVRPDTRRKVERIAKANRWSLVETIDAMADAFMQPSAGITQGSSAPADQRLVAAS